MKTNVHNFLNLKYFFLLFLLNLNCNSEDDFLSCIPNPTVNIQIDINLPAYSALQSAAGWVYVDAALAGNKGLIVVNTGTAYKAYDRNAPHICPTNNTTLIVENSLTLLCPQDNAKWILTTGQPVAVAGRSPRTYFVSKNGSILNISN